MISRILLAGILIALAQPVVAECPSRDDLKTGIRLSARDGATEVFTDIGGDVVLSVYKIPDLSETHVKLAHGAFVMNLVDLVGSPDEFRRETRFPTAIADIPMPAPNSAWEVTVEILEDGQAPYSELQSYRFGSISQITWKNCIYEYIPFDVIYDRGSDGVTEHIAYIPALGISYLAAITENGTRSDFPYTTIDVLE